MKILVACEESQTVTKAFRVLGHEAYSCDIQECSGGHHEWHYECNVFDVICKDWDIMIAHPPCTHLAVSGARWFKDKKKEQAEALDFVKRLMDAPIGKICIENPISIISSRIRKPDQIIQPWMFGHGETKATCLWLKGLPKLQPTNIVEGREQRIWKLPPGLERSKLRSKTYEGIANAMAEQWGK
jgi:site-specific DNA-cytosine methylase